MTTVYRISVFDVRIMSGAYRDKSLRAIVEDVAKRYMSDTVLSVGDVPDLVIAEAAFNRVTIRHCFDRLAGLAGCSWNVDEQKRIQFTTQPETTL